LFIFEKLSAVHQLRRLLRVELTCIQPLPDALLLAATVDAMRLIRSAPNRSGE
jgi:hypothetical protein